MPSSTASDASITVIQQMVSSCSGALLTSLFVTPMDVVKIRLQAQQKPGDAFICHTGLMEYVRVCNVCEKNGNGGSFTQNGKATLNGIIHSMKNKFLKKPWYDRPCYFNGTMDAVIKIARYEGVASLWSGLSPTLAMAVPTTVLYFTTYDHLKYALGYNEKDSSTRFMPALAGSSARAFASTVVSPLELIRTKMQSEQLSFREIREAVRTSIDVGGWSSLFRGLPPSLLRDVPFSAIYWLGYEYVKSYLMKRDGNIDSTPKFHQSFIAGALSGTVAAVLTLPFDVIKTHRQIELGKAEILKEKTVKSTWRLIVDLHQKNGVRGLFAGIVPRVMKVTPACAIMISSYEYGKSYFKDYNRKHGIT